jgi:hypothetical protein
MFLCCLDFEVLSLDYRVKKILFFFVFFFTFLHLFFFVLFALFSLAFCFIALPHYLTLLP